MTTEEIKAKMQEFETMINTADVSMADKLISPTATFFTPASPEPLKGGAGYLSFVFFMRSAFSNVQWKLEEMIAENDKVAVRWTCTGTHDGEFLGMPATGKSFSTGIMNFYYFDENGLIINDVAADGMIGILRALGMGA